MGLLLGTAVDFGDTEIVCLTEPSALWNTLNMGCRVGLSVSESLLYHIVAEAGGIP